jgi:hypothetical protein
MWLLNVFPLLCTQLIPIPITYLLHLKKKAVTNYFKQKDERVIPRKAQGRINILFLSNATTTSTPPLGHNHSLVLFLFSLKMLTIFPGVTLRDVMYTFI